MRILFFDPVAPRPYTCTTLATEALGGSEATLLRVARGLSRAGLDVAVFQLCDPHREEATIDSVRHVHDSSDVSPDVVVHMRTGFFVEPLRSQYPKARHVLWLHDIVPDVDPHLKACSEIVCVSRWHADDTQAVLGVDTMFIYNPVEIDGHRLDKIEGRLGFFSSPHKGFDEVRAQFAALRAKHAGLELVFSNPGYMPDSDAADTGLINLGQLPHHRVLEEMSRCQALFQVQTVFPETMGLVMAEANAMGTPVISHDFGAAKEVLEDGSDSTWNMVLDCTRTDDVKQALDYLLGQSADIEVQADPRFSLASVIEAWKKFLGV